MFMHFERNHMEPRPLEHLHYHKWADNLRYRDKVHDLDHQIYGPGDDDNVVYDYHQSRWTYIRNMDVNPPRTVDHAFAENVAPNYYKEERRTRLHGPKRPSDPDSDRQSASALPLNHPDRPRYNAILYGRQRLYRDVNMAMGTPHLNTQLDEVSSNSSQSEPDISPMYSGPP